MNVVQEIQKESEYEIWNKANPLMRVCMNVCIEALVDKGKSPDEANDIVFDLVRESVIAERTRIKTIIAKPSEKRMPKWVLIYLSCRYEWEYEGKSKRYTSCPRCRTSIKVRIDE